MENINNGFSIKFPVDDISLMVITDCEKLGTIVFIFNSDNQIR